MPEGYFDTLIFIKCVPFLKALINVEIKLCLYCNHIELPQ